MFKVNNKDTDFTPCSSIFIVNFEQVNASWVTISKQVFPKNFAQSIVTIRGVIVFNNSTNLKQEKKKFQLTTNLDS